MSSGQGVFLSSIRFRANGDVTDFSGGGSGGAVNLSRIRFRSWEDPILESLGGSGGSGGGGGGGGGPGTVFTVASTLTGTSGSVVGDNTAVTPISAAWGVALGYGNSASPPSNGYGGGKPVFYSFTPSSSGTLTVETSSAAGTPIGDTIMSIFTDGQLATNSVVASNDDFTVFYSKITYTVTSGTTYYIAVDGYNSGNFGASDADDPAWDGSQAAAGTFTLTWGLV